MTKWLEVALLVSAIASAAVGLMTFGFLLGFWFRNVYAEIYRILTRVNTIEQQLTEEPGSAIVETTPQLIEKKRRAGRLDDDDGAIVTVKTPAQLKADKDRKLAEELDRVSGR